MRTVGKALRILDLFTESTPLLTLTEIARVTEIDRATCHRMLKVLGQHGYVNQSADTKKYALGATVIRLARTREAVLPVSATLQAAVEDLTRETEETAHASVIAGYQVATVAASDGTRRNRVHVEHGGLIALHATATGLACLAFAPPDFTAQAMQGMLARHTPTTLTDAASLQAVLAQVRAQGFSVADGSFDADVVGIGAPIFGGDMLALGAIAVATPASRMTDELRVATARAVMQAALRATQNLGGTAPSDFLKSLALLAG